MLRRLPGHQVVPRIQTDRREHPVLHRPVDRGRPPASEGDRSAEHGPYAGHGAHAHGRREPRPEHCHGRGGEAVRDTTKRWLHEIGRGGRVDVRLGPPFHCVGGVVPAAAD